MERPSRRGSSNSHSGTNGASKDAINSSSRRRRREAESVASVSDGADTDSSSVGVDRPKPTSSRNNKPRTADKSKPKHASRGENEEEHTHEREEGEEEEEEGEEEEEEEEEDHHRQPEQDATTAGEEENGEEEEDMEEEEEEPQSTGYATRARRERSQSVVSTTSDTSSIVSELPEDPLQPELHGEKLQELEKKKKMVEEGMLAEFCRRVADFKEERNRLLQTAEWHKNLQLKNTQDLYGFEVQRAHNIWQENKDKVKDAMLVKADALLAQLKNELDLLAMTTTLPTHVVAEPKLIVPAQPPTAPAMALASTDEPPLKRRKLAALMPENVMRLPLDSIASDLAHIMQTREDASAKIHGNLDTPRLELSVDRRRLVCGKYVFEEGDEIVVTAVVLKQDHIGVISTVSDNEIYVVLTTGQKVRVSVDHIAQRRCEIRPFLRGSAGIESLQSSGWVECEPF